MKYSYFDELRQYVKKNLDIMKVKPGKGYIVGFGISDEKIREFSKNIGLCFSKEYEYFLKNFGEVVVEGYDIYGYGEKSIHNGISIVDKTNFYKEVQKWPGIEDWYIVSDDGRGNPIGCKPDGSVWLSDHDSNFEQIKLANDFEEFLHKLLTDTLYE